MPPAKPKPSEIAAETKKTYIPWIRQNLSADWPSTSYLCPSESMIAGQPRIGGRQVHFGNTFKALMYFVANLTQLSMRETRLILH
jgi:hypothetical protein